MKRLIQKKTGHGKPLLTITLFVFLFFPLISIGQGQSEDATAPNYVAPDIEDRQLGEIPSDNRAAPGFRTGDVSQPLEPYSPNLGKTLNSQFENDQWIIETGLEFTEDTQGFGPGNDQVIIETGLEFTEDTQGFGPGKAAGKADFVPLASIPGVTDGGKIKSPSEFFNGLFRISLVAAAFLAIIMIAVGGIQYMTTEAVSSKGEAKERIVAALSGLFLILLSVILLNIVNPDIVKLNLFN